MAVSFFAFETSNDAYAAEEVIYLKVVRVQDLSVIRFVSDRQRLLSHAI